MKTYDSLDDSLFWYFSFHNCRKTSAKLIAGYLGGNLNYKVNKRSEMQLYKNSQCSTIQAVVSRKGLNKIARKIFWQTTGQEFRDAESRNNYYGHIIKTRKLCKKKSPSKILH